jgi:hypothetical protein
MSVKRSKMMRGLSVKTPLFYESQLGSTRTVLLKAKIKRVTFMVLLKTTLVKPVERISEYFT